MQAGFAQADVTPITQVHLAGYFHRRPSTGVLDPLYARAAVLDDGATRLALVSVDLIGFPLELVDRLRSRLGAGFPHVLVTATHTHTAPVAFSVFGGPCEAEYVDGVLLPGVARACREAADAVAPCALLCGEAREKGLAFNRRYWMTDGRVVTNPPKGHPDIVRPEGPVDHQVNAYAFRNEGLVRGILVDACNHADTTGGSAVSADWPGHMARFVADELERDVPVLLLNGPAGNINHYDPDRHESQTSYGEAKRIGLGYARRVRRALARATEIEGDPLRVETRRFTMPYRTVSDEALAEARRLLAAEPAEELGHGTACDLAAGDPRILRLFARQLVKFAELREQRDAEEVELNAFRLGQTAFVGLPGECFVEIGLNVKRRSPIELTTVFALCNGAIGYIPLEEHIKHGGYETLTTPSNRMATNAGATFIRQGLALLDALTSRAPRPTP